MMQNSKFKWDGEAGEAFGGTLIFLLYLIRTYGIL